MRLGVSDEKKNKQEKSNKDTGIQRNPGMFPVVCSFFMQNGVLQICCLSSWERNREIVA